MIKKFIEKNKKHGANAVLSNTNYLIGALFGVSLSVFFIRIAGAERYGEYLFVLSIFNLLSLISITGVNTIIVKSIAQGYDGVYRKGTYFSFKHSLWGVPFLLFIGFIFLLQEKSSIGTSLIACSFLFPFLTSLKTWTPALKGRGDFKTLTIYNLILYPILLLSMILAISNFSNNLVVIVFCYVAVQSFFNILFFITSSRSFKLDGKIDIHWKKQSYALTISNLSGIVFGKADIFIMGLILAPEQIAIYGLTMKLGDIFFKFIKGTIESVLPKIYKDLSITLKYFYKPFALSFIIPLMIIPIIKYPVTLLYGPGYEDVVFLSQIYLIVIPFYFSYNITLSLLIKNNMNKEINHSRILAMLLVFVSYLLLIPLVGVLGGVISSIIFFVFQTFYNYFALKKNPSEQH
ncbi:MAG: hypothetical protein U9O20_00475 [Patescibacteria group bacterium]|nr:hypothetical protein [Patescibacteria group bacterium]